MAAFSEGRREGIRNVVAAFLGGFAVKLFSSGIAVLQETVSEHSVWATLLSD